jgi:hypothetical protein
MANGIDITNVRVDEDGNGIFDFDLGNWSGTALLNDGVVGEVRSPDLHFNEHIADGLVHVLQQAYDFWVA